MNTKAVPRVFINHSPSVTLMVSILLWIATLSQALSTHFGVIVPGIREGTTLSTVPFTGSSNSVRFQQVYSSAAFTSYGQRPYLIHQLQFRTDGAGPGYFSELPAFQINLSTTTRPVDGLSANFAENVGPDEIAVVPLGSYHVFGDYVRGNNPQLWSTFFIFPTPFFYDPSQGNLLLDIRNFGGGGTGYGQPPWFGPANVDATSITNDSTSCVIANDVNAVSGTASTLGLVTFFYVSPIPKLTASLQSSNVLIRWLYQQDSFVLQQSAIIGSGAEWQPAGGVAATNGTYIEITVPWEPNASARFFRLVLSSDSEGVQTVDPN